jgi:hypothetical protein
VKRGLQVVLAVGGLVAMVTGLVHIAGGVSTFPGSPAAENAADNEARFLAAFWVAFGAVAIWVVPRVERETLVVRALGGALILGGLARVVSIADVGEPDSFQYVLMAIELILGPLVIGWQALLRRARVTESR